MQKLVAMSKLEISKPIRIPLLAENITSKTATLGGKLKGNVNSDRINIKKTADIEGVLNQKTLSIEEGAVLKIKTETYK